jgi:hypothetical protein
VPVNSAGQKMADIDDNNDDDDEVYIKIFLVIDT